MFLLDVATTTVDVIPWPLRKYCVAPILGTGEYEGLKTRKNMWPICRLIKCLVNQFFWREAHNSSPLPKVVLLEKNRPGAVAAQYFATGKVGVAV